MSKTPELFMGLAVPWITMDPQLRASCRGRGLPMADEALGVLPLLAAAGPRHGAGAAGSGVP